MHVFILWELHAQLICVSNLVNLNYKLAIYDKFSNHGHYFSVNTVKRRRGGLRWHTASLPALASGLGLRFRLSSLIRSNSAFFAKKSSLGITSPDPRYLRINDLFYFYAPNAYSSRSNKHLSGVTRTPVLQAASQGPHHLGNINLWLWPAGPNSLDICARPSIPTQE